MGRLIDVDVLFDYFGNDAIDEITRSNIEYFISEKGTVEAIPKAEYEARLNAAMVAVLKEIQLEIEELEKPHCHNASHADGCVSKWKVEGVIQQKIENVKEGYNTHWILVKDRLPEDGTWNVFTDGKTISVERYKMDAMDHFYPSGRWFELEDAVAWMPLPPHYSEKGGKNGET